MSGPRLEKWKILGSSQYTRNPISINWIFCSTGWWTSEFCHFCNQISKLRFTYNFTTLIHITWPHVNLYHTKIAPWRLVVSSFEYIIWVWKHQLYVESEKTSDKLLTFDKSYLLQLNVFILLFYTDYVNIA